MPYGAVDLDYIISQATVDETGQMCFRQQALKAADHLLISRYFDYQQLPFHKTVVAIELLLEEIFEELFRLGIIDCSALSMLRKVADGSWASFDDQHVTEVFRNFLRDPPSGSEGVCNKIRAILDRRPPTLLASAEGFISLEETFGPLSLERLEHDLKGKIPS
jgi:hypothetical protein